MTESINEDTTRPCEYTQCRRRFAYSGFGAPRKYCGPPERTWPDKGGKTCKQLAAEERAAAKAAGLDGALAAYVAAADPVLEGIEALRADLAKRAEAGRVVQAAAGEEVTAARQAATEALEAAATAETERDQALRQTAAAVREKDQAKDGQRAAERLARDAAADRDLQVQDAWRRIGEHQDARVDAERRAGEQAGIATHEREQRAREAERADKLAAANKDLTAGNKALARDLAAARADAEHARAETERIRAEAAAELDRMSEETKAARTEANNARADAERAHTDAEHTHAASDRAIAQTRQEMAAVREDAARVREDLLNGTERLQQAHAAQVAALDQTTAQALTRAEEISAERDRIAAELKTVRQQLRTGGRRGEETADTE